MRKSLCCKRCNVLVDTHARGYCHICYKHLRRNGVLNRLHNATNELTTIQKEVLIGSLLGDGFLRIAGKTKRANANFGILRCLDDKDYIDWEFNLFKNIVIKTEPTCGSLFDKRTQKYYNRIYFQTMSCKLLTEYYHKWYPNGIKIVPNDLELSSLSIAIWFCDDGNVCHGKSRHIFNITFATNSFSKDEVYFLRDKLTQRYNEKYIVSKTFNNGNEQYLLRATNNNAARAILKDIDKHINGFMDRKTSIWRCDEAKFYSEKVLNEVQ
jgi:hypothetical protein